MAHTLLLFDGLDSTMTDGEHQAAAALVRSFAADTVDVVRVRREAAAGDEDQADLDAAIHRAFAAHRPLAVWVRPDKYIGFRGDPRSTGALRAYLEGLFLRQGTVLPEHHSPVPVVIQALQGAGTVTAGTEHFRVDATHAVLLAPNVPHAVAPDDGTDLVLLVQHLGRGEEARP